MVSLANYLLTTQAQSQTVSTIDFAAVFLKDTIVIMRIEKDLFARHVGIEILDMAAGRATARLKIEKHHLNGIEITQGGAIFTLADFVLAAASNSHGPVAVAINASISFCKPTGQGSVLTAEAREVSRNRKTASYTIQVSDDNNETVAIFQGMVYIKKSSS